MNVHECDVDPSSRQMFLTLTYWFSSIFVPLTLSWQAWESKSTVSTHKVKVVRTLELPTLPVEDSVCTFLEGGVEMYSINSAFRGSKCKGVEENFEEKRDLLPDEQP